MATFNLRRGLGKDDRTDLSRSARAIVAAEADLVALQELDRYLERSGGVDQPSELGALTGLEIRFWPTLRRGAGEYGIAIAARRPIDATFRQLPRLRPQEEPRGAAVGRVGGLSVVATHLALRRGSRALQTRALAALAGELEPPVAVMGDLNQGFRSLGPLRDAGLSPGPKRHATVRTRAGPRQLDWVLAGRGAAVADSWILPTDASDHDLVVAEVVGRLR